MKQLNLTPDIEARIKSAVGEDVDLTGIAVFEAIAINDRPLPGKRGTFFESARVSPLTLKQMSDSINAGNHLPLISDHELSGTPKGRVFAASTYFAADGSNELRVLFYLDRTEETVITKLNSGSLDEVSVKFMASQAMCSECGWDYFGSESTAENIYTRTCENDHTIGKDGVHVRLVGLNQFVELSLVARGAADKPKIVGKSESKLKPTGMQLAAKGFEIDRLVCQASRGEERVSFDADKLITQLSDARGEAISLGKEKDQLEIQLNAANEGRQTAETRVTELEAEVAELRAKPDNQADYNAALSFLQDVYKNLLTASGAEASGELPATVAELTAGIKEKTNDLTAILPVEGVSTPAGSDEVKKPALIASAFTNRSIG